MFKFRKIATTTVVISSILLPFQAFAGDTGCFRDDVYHNAAYFGNESSWAMKKQHTNKTWEDWIWRGPIYTCPNAKGAKGCNYTWGQSKTTGYTWAAGVSIDGPKYLTLLHLNASYGKSVSFTTNFNYGVDFDPGKSAQPIQLVDRQWTTGDFQGAYVNTGKECVWGGGSNVKSGHWYKWDGAKRFGKWQANLAIRTRHTYYVY